MTDANAVLGPPRSGVPPRRGLRAGLRRGSHGGRHARRTARARSGARRPGNRRRGEQQHGPGTAPRLDGPRLRPSRRHAWSHTAAQGRCTPASWHGRCRWDRSSCLGIRARSRLSARSSPTRVSTTRRRTGCACATSIWLGSTRSSTTLERQAADEFLAEGFTEPPLVRRAIDLRYVGQNWELSLELPAGALAEQRLRRRRGAVRRRARAVLRLSPPRRGARDPDVQAGRARHAARARAADVSRPARARARRPPSASCSAATTPRSRRRSTVETSFRPKPGSPVPPSIGQVDATTLLPPGSESRVDEYGNLHVTI